MDFQFTPTRPEKFKYLTHLNYIRCIEGQLKDVSINLQPQHVFPLNSNATRFKNLANATAKSIATEYQICLKDEDFAQAISMWVPVKCYYLIYYLEAVLVFLLTGNEDVFNNQGHVKCKNLIKQCIKNGMLTFSNEKLNEIIKSIDIQGFSAGQGQTLQPTYHLNDDCIKSVKKKIYDYMEVAFRDKHRLVSGYRSNSAKEKKRRYLDQHEIILVDYFYWMRIKTNYKIADFLDNEKDISIREAAIYVQEYIRATYYLQKALRQAIGELTVSQ